MSACRLSSLFQQIRAQKYLRYSAGRIEERDRNRKVHQPRSELDVGYIDTADGGKFLIFFLGLCPPFLYSSRCFKDVLKCNIFFVCSELIILFPSCKFSFTSHD